MDITVNKPQFDVAKLRPGTALHIQLRQCYSNRFSKNCLVYKCDPLELSVVYVSVDTDGGKNTTSYETRYIKISEIDQYDVTELVKFVPERIKLEGTKELAE
jgi:hypothetical protein